MKHITLFAILLALGLSGCLQKKKLEIESFSYLPRQDGEKGGIIYEYAFYVSETGKNWEDPVAVGKFSNIENNPNRQHIKFENEIKGRYIKLISKSTTRQSGFASFAEIEVFGVNDLR